MLRLSRAPGSNPGKISFTGAGLVPVSHRRPPPVIPLIPSGNGRQEPAGMAAAGPDSVVIPVPLPSMAVCPRGGNRAQLEPGVGEVMVQTREDPAPDHGE